MSRYRSAIERTEGFLKLFLKDGEWLICRRNELEGLLVAWRAARGVLRGPTDYELTDLYGDVLWIDLLHVVGIAEATPAGIRRHDEEEEAREAHNLATGRDD